METIKILLILNSLVKIIALGIKDILINNQYRRLNNRSILESFFFFSELAIISLRF